MCVCAHSKVYSNMLINHHSYSTTKLDLMSFKQTIVIHLEALYVLIYI